METTTTTKTPNAFFDKVKETLDGKPVTHYSLMLKFYGTYGKKRKADLQFFEALSLNAESEQTLDEETFLATLKETAINLIQKHNIKLSRGFLYLSFSGVYFYAGGYESDSNLMLNAPTFIFDQVNNTIEHRSK